MTSAADRPGSEPTSRYSPVKELSAVSLEEKRPDTNHISSLSRRNVKLSEAETASTVSLDVHSIGLMFGDRCLLRNMSFAIKSGDRVGIVGPNGSGKV